MNKILEQALLKQALPMVAPKIAELETRLMDYLKGIPLVDDETHATIVLDLDAGRAHFVVNVCTFCGRMYARTIKQLPVAELTQLLLQNS